MPKTYAKVSCTAPDNAVYEWCGSHIYEICCGRGGPIMHVS